MHSRAPRIAQSAAATSLSAHAMRLVLRPHVAIKILPDAYR
jgi:hypothetical protein